MPANLGPQWPTIPEYPAKRHLIVTGSFIPLDQSLSEK